MSSKGSGRKLEGFFTGKGFYIVLFLCAAVIGVSAWMMATGKETMSEDIGRTNGMSMDNSRIETVIIPPVSDNDDGEQTAQAVKPQEEPEMQAVPAEAPEINSEGLAETAAEGETAENVWSEGDFVPAEAPDYSWPVCGEIERRHCSDVLNYDVTMRDWRTHSGIDICADLGTTVLAARAGTVESIEEDDFLGTAVILDHGDGIKSVYANLAALPAVSTGDWVDSGSVIGSVGSTALSESGQGSHLHFEILKDGISVNPMEYLPE